MIRVILIIHLFLFTSSNTFAQQWVTYTYLNTRGLAGNVVTSIAKDQNHNLWFATDEGVVEYETSNNLWPRYNIYNGLGSNLISRIFVTSDNTVWAATNIGACKFSGSQYYWNSWTTYTEDDGLAGNVIRDIAEDASSNLWFATYGSGVSKLNGTTWTTYTSANGLASNLVNCIFADDDNLVWFGTASGVSRFNGVTWQTFSTANGLPSNMITAVAQDANGNIWVGTDAGAARYDGSNWQTFDESNGLSNNMVFDILLDNENQLVFATENGASIYDGTSWISYNTTDGMASDVNYAVVEDEQHQLWFGHEISGVSVFDGSTWTIYAQTEGLLSSYVNDMCEDKDGNMLFATSNGISKFDGEHWTSYTTANSGIPTNYIDAIGTDHDGNIWIGYYNGISKFDGTSWSNSLTTSLYVYCIFTDSKNNVWFGTYNGVYEYDGSSFHQFTVSDGIGENYVYSITENIGGKIWISGNSVISVYDGAYWKVINPFADLYSWSYIYQIYADGIGNIWMAYSDGLKTLNNKNQWTEYHEAGDFVYSISKDDLGRMWFGSYAELTIKNGNDWGSYFSFDGVYPSTIYKIHRDSKGYMWLAHSYGVTRADPDLISSVQQISPHEISLNAFPNPFNESTTIRSNLQKTSDIVLSIYDGAGRILQRQNYQNLPSGEIKLSIDGEKLPAGILLVELMINGEERKSLRLIKAQ